MKRTMRTITPRLHGMDNNQLTSITSEPLLNNPNRIYICILIAHRNKFSLNIKLDKKPEEETYKNKYYLYINFEEMYREISEHLEDRRLKTSISLVSLEQKIHLAYLENLEILTNSPNNPSNQALLNNPSNQLLNQRHSQIKVNLVD